MRITLTTIALVLAMASPCPAEVEHFFDPMCDYLEGLAPDTDLDTLLANLALEEPDLMKTVSTLFIFKEAIWFDVNGMRVSVGLRRPPKLKQEILESPLRMLGHKIYPKTRPNGQEYLLYTGHYSIRTNNTTCFHWQYTNEPPIRYRGTIESYEGFRETTTGEPQN